MLRQSGDRRWGLLYLIQGNEQGVDDGVAGHKDFVVGKAFLQKVCPGCCRWREMQVREVGGKHAVGFLRPGRVQIVRAKARFHMGDGDVVIKGGQGRAEDGGRVSLNHDHIRLLFVQIAIQGFDGAGGQASQGLVVLHQVQIHIRDDLECLEHLIQHFPVLGSDADAAVELGICLEGQNDRGQFDGLRPGAKDDRDFFI